MFSDDICLDLQREKKCNSEKWVIMKVTIQSLSLSCLQCWEGDCYIGFGSILRFRSGPELPAISDHAEQVLQ